MANLLHLERVRPLGEPTLADVHRALVAMAGDIKSIDTRLADVEGKVDALRQDLRYTVGGCIRWLGGMAVRVIKTVRGK